MHQLEALDEFPTLLHSSNRYDHTPGPSPSGRTSPKLRRSDSREDEPENSRGRAFASGPAATKSPIEAPLQYCSFVDMGMLAKIDEVGNTLKRGVRRIRQRPPARTAPPPHTPTQGQQRRRRDGREGREERAIRRRMELLGKKNARGPFMGLGKWRTRIYYDVWVKDPLHLHVPPHRTRTTTGYSSRNGASQRRPHLQERAFRPTNREGPNRCPRRL